MGDVPLSNKVELTELVDWIQKMCYTPEGYPRYSKSLIVDVLEALSSAIVYCLVHQKTVEVFKFGLLHVKAVKGGKTTCNKNSYTLYPRFELTTTGHSRVRKEINARYRWIDGKLVPR